MKTVARNVECQIAPLEKKLNIKEMFNNGTEEKLISTEIDAVFLTQEMKNSHKVYDEFSKQVTREVGFR